MSPRFIILLFAATFFLREAEAGNCWNFVTGSRCDNEAFWEKLGYPRCDKHCKNNGNSGGKCTTMTERCLFLKRKVNVCKCY